MKLRNEFISTINSAYDAAVSLQVVKVYAKTGLCSNIFSNKWRSFKFILSHPSAEIFFPKYHLWDWSVFELMIFPRRALTTNHSLIPARKLQGGLKKKRSINSFLNYFLPILHAQFTVEYIMP